MPHCTGRLASILLSFECTYLGQSLARQLGRLSNALDVGARKVIMQSAAIGGIDVERTSNA